jgi:hypothetical protein
MFERTEEQLKVLASAGKRDWVFIHFLWCQKVVIFEK